MTASESSIADEAESLVRSLAAELTLPHPGECLCCYVARQLESFGCNGTHRHSFHYRDVTAPRATGLRNRLSGIGACCCDCELFLNAYMLRAEVGRRPLVVERDGYLCEIDPPELPLPVCAGVRRGSTQPCNQWVRQRYR